MVDRYGGATAKRLTRAVGTGAVACSLVALAACGSGGSSGSSGGAAGPVKRGGSITVGLQAGFTGLDPNLQPNQESTWIDSLVYSRLIRLNANQQIVGDLATSWSQESSTKYVFHMRKGVKFQDGTPLTAKDVVYTFNRILDPKSASAAAYLFSAIKSVQAPDNYTVDFTLSQPDASFLSHVASVYTSVVNPTSITKYHNLNSTMDGSGAYNFVSQQAGQQVVLKANPGYYVKGEPNLSGITLQVMQDESSRINALKSGSADLVDFVPENDVASLKADTGIVVGPGRSENFYALMMFLQHPPFNNVKVRQAIMYALDRKAIINGALFGQGVLLNDASIPNWNKYFGKPVYGGPDVAKAKQLMQEAGVSNVTATIGLWSSQTYVVNAAQIIQSELQPIGIKLKIVQYGDYPSYAQAVFVSAKDDLTIQGFGGNVDPDDYLAKGFATKAADNFFGYSNTTLDGILNQARATSNVAQRQALYDQAQQIVATTGPMAFLFSESQPEAWQSYLKGFQHYPDLSLDSLITAWVDKS